MCVLCASDMLLSAAYQRRKNVIIAVDVGNSLSANQLLIAKAVAKHIVFSLGSSDWVSSQNLNLTECKFTYKQIMFV